MKLASLILVIAMFAGLARADFVFSWTDCSNRLAGSQTVLWQGKQGALNYSTPYPTFGTNFVFSSSLLKPGANYFAVQQIATNSAGKAMFTPLSGEIQIQVNPLIAVDVQTLASTNLGYGWSVVGNQTLYFPTTQDQQFFLTQQRARSTNEVILPPAP